MRLTVNNSKPTEVDFKNNSVKVVRRFLFLPKMLNREFRWLETTEWFKFVDCKGHYYDGGGHGYTYHWKDLCWCDNVPSEFYEEGRFLNKAIIVH